MASARHTVWKPVYVWDQLAWSCFSVLYTVLLKISLPWKLTKRRGRKGDACEIALWWIGSPVWGWAAPCQHDSFLVRLSLPQSLHCTRHLFLYFSTQRHLRCSTLNPLLPEVYEEDFQQDYSFKGVGDISFCTFLRIWAHTRSTYKKKTRWGDTSVKS